MNNFEMRKENVYFYACDGCGKEIRSLHISQFQQWKKVHEENCKKYLRKNKEVE